MGTEPNEIPLFHLERKEEIEERGLLKKDVAGALKIMPHHLSEIFAGKRNISATLAVRIEKLLGISSQYWLGMQTEYELFLAKKAEAHALEDAVYIVKKGLS